jgi:peptidoglycan/LPS O-acetylase OafA/YrhL
VVAVVQARQVHRRPEIDNLRTLMVVWIIAGHAVLGYSAIGGWPYDEVQEVTLARRSELVLAVVVGPSALFVVAMFFFVAGLLAPVAAARRGIERFTRERLLRLGLPWLAFTLLLWPLSMWFAYRAAGRDVSYWWAFTHRQPLLDSGPLWFAEILLYFSLGYAAWIWAAARLGRGPAGEASPLTGRHLVGLGVALAVASFAVRMVFPARSTQIFDLHLWQWPQCLAMFAFGVAASRRGWLAAVPPRLHRGCGVVILTTLAFVPLLPLLLGITDVAADATAYVGGWHWQALLLASLEACLVVAGSVWLLGLAQRRLARTSKLSETCGRSSYAAFVLQAPVLLVLAVAARPLALPAEGKALLVGAFAVPACLWLGWLSTERTQLGRIL